MRLINAIFVALASLSLACAAYAKIETPKGMPEPGSAVNAAPVACQTLEDARKFADLAQQSADKAREFAGAEGNTCGFARGQFSVNVVEYVEYRGGAVIVKISAPTVAGTLELYAVYKVPTESLEKRSEGWHGAPADAKGIIDF